MRASRVKLLIFAVFALKLCLLFLYFYVWRDPTLSYLEYVPVDLRSYYRAFGNDELFYHFTAVLFKNLMNANGLSLNFTPFMADTLHFGHSYLFALLMYFFDIDVLGFLVVKLVLFHFIGAWYFYKFAYLYSGSYKSAFVALAFLLIYPTININFVSLLREELIFTFMATTMYFGFQYAKVPRFRYLMMFIASLIVLLTFRGHAAAASFIFIGLVFLSHGIFKRLELRLIIFGLILLIGINGLANFDVYYLYIQGVIQNIIVGFPLVKFVTEIPRIMISPLPWNISNDGYHEYIRYWYLVSLFFILLSLFRLDLLLKSMSKYKWPIVFFIAVYFFIYLTLQDYGPRQFSVVGPFLFVFFYSVLVRKIVSPSSKNITR